MIGRSLIQTTWKQKRKKTSSYTFTVTSFYAENVRHSAHCFTNLTSQIIPPVLLSLFSHNSVNVHLNKHSSINLLNSLSLNSAQIRFVV